VRSGYSVSIHRVFIAVDQTSRWRGGGGMSKKLYAVLALKDGASVAGYVAGIRVNEIRLPFSGIADGCVGALMVFRKKRDAKKYAGKYPITELEDHGRITP
jgi:hypothetical protein